LRAVRAARTSGGEEVVEEGAPLWSHNGWLELPAGSP
jgi:hypothetical protein